ncbi:hypothetical protein, variant 1 [Aphanomyces invadans]|uniref:Uncharacterized protein n=1 Tax=Aphanomyces invadans TaxID=157072 RepID=A0A024U582_9STRA|nr:hypothetical protein, variant 1 [Aphanomyces invadans]ETW01571.1 hypothetical protein, variant 1 [Aphanomyces invadans]|eukprot:XP_008869419.1 hypothetical protein, variant 1 [Aphanomyces invadans]
MELRKRLSVGLNVESSAKEQRPPEKRSHGRSRSRSRSSDADVAHKLQRNNDIAGMLERNEIVAMGTTSSTDTAKCDLCDGLWTDESASALFEFRPSGIVCDQSCLAFAASFVEKHPSIQSRDDYLNYRRSVQPNQSGVFKIVADKAVDLPSVRWVGRQDPYVRLALLPWNEPVQTKAAMSGGKNPVWLDAHANEMRLQHRCNSSNNPVPTLEVQVWNENYMFAHDLLASSLVTTAPLLQHPGISISRWFTLVSPSNSTSSLSQRARIYFTMQFDPQTRLHRLVSSDPAEVVVRDHKFRVHSLKSVGVCILSCGVCERVIMSTIKTQWGYRCEGCGIDVHKGCMMLANTNLPCPRQDQDSSGSNNDNDDGIDDRSVLKRDRYVVSPKDGSSGYLLVQPPLSANPLPSFGKLYVNVQGAHMCSKHCNAAENLHASNIFDGDTYCRLSVDGVRHESKEVYKSADPVYDDKSCFDITHRDTTLLLEVVDLTTNVPVGSMSVLLFELLQMDADEVMQSLPTPRFVHTSLHGSTLFNRAKTTFPLKLKSQVVGHVHVSLHYAEEKQKLLLYVPKQRMVLQGREEKDFSVETLKTNIDRLARVLALVPWLEQQYVAIITWKHPVQSGVILAWFTAACLFLNAEYLPASFFLVAIAYMLYTLWQRLTGAYLLKWVAFDEDVMESSRLFRPVASLFVAVLEASYPPKEMAPSSTAHYVFVRANYLPNDMDVNDSGLVYSGGDEFVIGRTHAVRQTPHPTWRDGSNVVSHLTPPGLFRPNTPPKKEHVFRNAHVSWPTHTTNGAPVTDYHTLVYPLVQAAKRFDNGRELLVPWTAFPGLLRCDLVQVAETSPGHAVTGEIVLASTAPIPLVRLVDSDEETLTLPLVLNSKVSTAGDEEPRASLTVRLKMQLPPRNPSSSASRVGAGPAEKRWSKFVQDALAEKDAKTTLSTTLFGALWKAKDTTTTVQNAIGRLCATVVCTQNLFNWTHPWKTALVFGVCVGGSLLFSFVPARYLILVGGLLEVRCMNVPRRIGPDNVCMGECGVVCGGAARRPATE